MFKAQGCLVIHGFGGSTEEIRPLAAFLSKSGFEVVCPSLKGHTGKRKDLAASNYIDWIKSAEEGLKELQRKCLDVYILGFSMGGLIALNLAMEHNVSGVITLNAPIFIWDFKRMAINIAEDIKAGKVNNIKRYVVHTLRKPLGAYVNFKKLLNVTKSKLHKFKAPILIIQGLEDDTVQHKSAGFIFEKVSSMEKKIKYYGGSGHLICFSRAIGDVFDDIGDFLERLKKDRAS